MAITKKLFGKTADGIRVDLYTLSNNSGLAVEVMTYGATLTSVATPDRHGKSENITLGMATLDEYLAGHPFFGSIAGRFANRIAEGRFSIDGRQYTLATNNGPHHLHGGNVGFDKKVWAAETIEEDDCAVLQLSYQSPDGEEGYPGTLLASATYMLSDDDQLMMAYTATTDKPTHVNLTNHAYWNLSGQTGGDVLDHELTIDADNYLEVDEGLVPLGPPSPVAGTEMDFTQAQTIGSRIAQTDGGYDHCYVLNKEPEDLEAKILTPTALVHDPKSGRVMEVYSTQPGVQLYTANFLDGGPRSGGFTRHAGLCLETQHYPDSPNRPEYPSTLLVPGETYEEVTVHKFGVKK
ncbi:MAG: aldose epimerase family protein [Planctomycetota bacterium]|nr:aldose epimerase family protein [Planctomycetota bacterium]